MGRVLGLYSALVAALIAAIFFVGITSSPSGNIHNRAVNVDGFGGFLSAITAAGTNDCSLLVTRVHDVVAGTSCTVSPNTELIFTPGSGISVHSGATVEFNGSIVAGPYRIVFGSGDSVFGTRATEPFFINAWIGGATEVGRSRQPGAGYGLDVRGVLRADNLSGALPFTSLTGTATNDQLPDPVTKGIETGNVVAGMIRTIEINSSVSTEVLEISGASGQVVTGVSNIARDPESGVSIRFLSPAGGENAHVMLSDDTAQTGTTITVLFEAGDAIICAYDIIAGTSKFILSGPTDAQSLTLMSTGTSEWFVRGYGAPDIDWE